MCELDNNFKKSILSAKRNANYLSKTTQNDLLLCIKEYIQHEIVKEIKKQPEGPFYGLSADEVTDVSNWEQLGVIVSYTKDFRPVEKLLEYVHCEDIKGTSIANYLITTLKDAGLDVLMCRSQTYDGAGNMSGKSKGAAAVFRSKTGNENAVCFYCASYELNLCLSKPSKVPQVFNMVSPIQAFDIFFKYSPKCQRKREEAIAEANKEGCLKKKIKPLCETRWVDKHTAFDDLNQLYKPLLNCLDSIQSNGDPDNRFDAKSTIEAAGLLKQLQSLSFIISFHTCHYLLVLRKNFLNSSRGQQLRLRKSTKWNLW